MILPSDRPADGHGGAAACHQRGLEHLSGNRPDLALAELEQALRLDPRNQEFIKSLGNAHKAMGSREKAVDCYRRSLALMPDYLPSLYNLGLILHEMNRLEEAEELFRRFCEIEPRDVDVLIHLGLVYCKRSQFADGERTFRLALKIAPGNPFLWMCLGNACRELGNSGEAVAAYRAALELEPGSADALDGLGNILQEQGRLDEAIENYRAAIRSAPGSAVSYTGLGCALLRKNSLDEAVESFRKAIGLQPDLAGAHLNLGNALSLRGACDLAVRSYQTALELRPGDAAIRECLLYEMQSICDWSRLDELCALQRQSVSDSQLISPFSLLTIPSSAREQLQCAGNFAKRQAAAVAAERERLAFRFDRAPRSKLRIGYLSADFHDHVTAYVMAEMFELHDRSCFETIAYSYGPDDASPVRARLKRAFSRFVDVRTFSHAAAASAIHADRVDILVDLKGYTQHARTEISALRPAPVQVSYMGYPGTMAADFIDYFIVDRYVVPAAQVNNYGEKLVFMPGSYYVNDRKRPVMAPPPRRELGLPERSIVFCCFNQTYKILPGVFSRWMRLLAAVPGSVLWLLETNRWAQQNLRREASGRGIQPDRLIFAPRVSSDRHLARIGAADLFLDTLPYNAHTTATDALWVGLPVLTLPGETFASRVAGSLLTAAGMPELIAGSAAEYEALALGLARDPARLAALRDKLVRGRVTAPLFDTPAFTRHLETAYKTMWRIHRSGSAPRSIEL